MPNDNNAGNDSSVDLAKAKVLLGNSSQAQLKKEARDLVAEARKEVRRWDRLFSSDKR